MKRTLVCCILTAAVFTSLCCKAAYDADWKSLDKRPVPSWWTEAKFGIFIHWGPYAVPAFAPVFPDGAFSWDGFAEWYQGKMIAKTQNKSTAKFGEHHKKHYAGAPYANFAAQFTARFFNAADWAELFKRAGAKYAVLTSKHHDGYALWPSSHSPYFNSVSIGSGRDLAGEFAAAMKAASLRYGFYFSMLEYANPLYPSVRDGVRSPDALSIAEWNDRVNIPQLKDLVNRYEPDILWGDGEWDYTSLEHGVPRFMAWLYNDSKVKDHVVVNDRWGKDCRGVHGGHYTTEYGDGDGATKKDRIVHPWEECRGIGGSFGYNRFETTANYMSRRSCIEMLVSVCARGGNLLLNIGPDADGLIPVIMQDRLLAIGKWLQVNGEAIYGTTCWNDGDVALRKKGIYFTLKGEDVYVITFNWPTEISFPCPGRVKDVSLVGSSIDVPFAVSDGVVTLRPPAISPTSLPCEHAWVFKVSR